MIRGCRHGVQCQNPRIFIACPVPIDKASFSFSHRCVLSEYSVRAVNNLSFTTTKIIVTFSLFSIFFLEVHKGSDIFIRSSGSQTVETISSTQLLEQMEFTELVRHAQAGSAEASRALFDRCQQPLLAVIRQVIKPRLRQPGDLTISCARPSSRFTTYFAEEVLRSPETPLGLSQENCRNKVRDANRKYLNTQRHNINRVRSLESLEPEELEECLRAKGLAPDEALLLKELVEERLCHLIGQLPSMMQKIIELLLGGATTAEIADHLGVEPKRVYRAMEWLKKKIRE